MKSSTGRRSPDVRSRLVAGLAVGATVLLLGAGCGQIVDTSQGPTTTVAASTAPTTTPAAVAPCQCVVWPPADGSISYSDPVEAARGFATQLVGFTDPVMGEFMAGDSRSGEVEVRAKPDGAVTTVFVRQVGSDSTWSVLGSATANINFTSPAAMDEISSPLRATGTSTAFEAVVQLAVKDRSGGGALGSGTFMGGSMGEMGPFDTTLAFSSPATSQGSVIGYTLSAEDGSVWEASVLGIRFAGAPDTTSTTGVTTTPATSAVTSPTVAPTSPPPPMAPRSSTGMPITRTG